MKLDYFVLRLFWLLNVIVVFVGVIGVSIIFVGEVVNGIGLLIMSGLMYCLFIVLCE